MIDRRRFIATGAAAAVTAPALVSCGPRRETPRRPEGVPSGPYGDESTAEEVTTGIDLSGKVALVTGATSGLGLETMRVLALRGAHVIGTGRTLEKARQACATVPGETTPLELELEREDRRWIYEVKLLQPGGRIVALEVDARSAELLKQRSRDRHPPEPGGR